MTHLVLGVVCDLLRAQSHQWSQVLTEALLSTTVYFSAVTRARSKLHTTPNMGCVTILYTCCISESSPYRRTSEHHRVSTDNYSVVLTSSSAYVRVYLLISHLQRIVTHPVLGVVCDLLRARVTAEKYTVVLKSASVRT